MSEIWTPALPVENTNPDMGGADPDLPNATLLPLPDNRPINYSSNGAILGALVASGPCRLFGFAGYDANSSGEFVLVFDLNVVPASSAAAAIVISTGTAAGNFSYYAGTAGRWFYRGIYIVSSSAATYTAQSTANMYLDVQYA